MLDNTLIVSPQLPVSLVWTGCMHCLCFALQNLKKLKGRQEENKKRERSRLLSKLDDNAGLSPVEATRLSELLAAPPSESSNTPDTVVNRYSIEQWHSYVKQIYLQKWIRVNTAYQRLELATRWSMLQSSPSIAKVPLSIPNRVDRPPTAAKQTATATDLGPAFPRQQRPSHWDLPLSCGVFWHGDSQSFTLGSTFCGIIYIGGPRPLVTHFSRWLSNLLACFIQAPIHSLKSRQERNSTEYTRHP